MGRILIFGRSGEMGSKAAGAGIPVFAGPEPLAHLKHILDAFSSLVILSHHCYIGWELAAQRGAKIVEVIHNTYHWQLGDDFKRDIQSLADQFAAVSRSARDYAATYLGIDAGKTVVVNNGWLPDGFAQPSISEMDRLRSDFEFRILQVAILMDTNAIIRC